jgi:hypothetical protein
MLPPDTMSVIDQFLKNPSETGSLHPLIRVWDSLLKRSRGDARCRVERRRQGLSYLPTKLWLELTLQSGEPEARESDWDAELNRWLMEKKVRAIDAENEAVRFQLVLRELLQKTEVRLGDGSFSAVLIDVLKNTGLASDRRIATLLAKVGHHEPSRANASQPAVDTIKAVFSTCARSLQDLGYNDDAVLNILVGAIVRYLDDRFSVTNRSLIGVD